VLHSSGTEAVYLSRHNLWVIVLAWGAEMDWSILVVLALVAAPKKR
jgi:hypothetical protein